MIDYETNLYNSINSIVNKSCLNNYLSNQISINADQIYNPFGIDHSSLQLTTSNCITEGYRLFKTHNFLKIERI